MAFPAAARSALELKAAIVRDPLVVTPDAPVMDAIAQMSGVRTVCSALHADQQIDALQLEARSSCVVVVEDQRVVGILTERDVVRLSAQQPCLDHLQVGQVMGQPVVTLQETDFDDLFLALDLLRQHRIRHLPVLDENGGVVGLLTHESLRQLSRPIDLLRLRLAEEVMVREVVCAAPQSSLMTIAQQMAVHQISSVVIVESEGDDPHALSKPVGIFTERDLVQLKALGLDLVSCPAEAVMSTPVFSVPPQASLWTVQQRMQQHFIQRLAVTGSQGELLGIITQTSLLQALNPLELYQLAEALEAKVERLEAEKVALLKNRTVELEQQVKARTAVLVDKARQEQLLTTVADQLRSSLDVQTILDNAVSQVRSLLECDRTIIYRLQADFSGTVVAESLVGASRSVIHSQVHDPCISPEWIAPYRAGNLRVVNDVYTESLSRCHQEMLIGFDIRAKIMAPIVIQDELWGLMIASQHDQPRHWTTDEIELLQKLSVQIAIALRQGITHQQLQTELNERKQTEARLRDSQQRYASLAAAVPVGIFRADSQGSYVYVNQRWGQMAGLSPKAASGEGWRQALHPEDRERVVAEWLRATQTQAPFQLEYRLQRPSGAVTWVYGQAVAERNADDQVVGYIGSITDVSERRRFEAERQQAEKTRLELKLLEQIFDVVLAGYWDWDIPNHREYLSPGFKRVFGYKDDELPNSPDSWRQLIFPEDLSQVERKLEQHFQSSGTIPFYSEARYRHRDGSTVWILCSGQVIEWDEIGQPLRMIGCHINISDRKRSEQQLQEREARYRALMDGASDAILIASREGVLLEVNHQAEVLLGYSRDELTGMAITQFHRAEDLPELRAAFEQALTQGRTQVLDVNCLRSDGQLVPVDINASTVEINGDTVVQGIFRDICDRKAIEASLEQARERNRAMLWALPDIVFRLNRDGVYLDFFASDTTPSLADPATIVGHTLQTLLPPDIAAAHYRDLQRALQTQTMQVREQQVWINGQHQYEEVRVVPCGQDEAVFVVRNITSRKQAEAQLQRVHKELLRATRLKDEFLANMSHELRTPLNAILGLAEGLQEDVFGEISQRQGEALQTIEHSGTHLLSLINDILDVAKIESGQMELEPAATAVASLCHSSLVFVQQQARKKQIQLETRIPDPLPLLWIDERRIRQVLINLLNNAVKFTPEGGRITLEVGASSSLPGADGQDFLQIAIADTGIGISANNIRKLFQPFVQVDSALDRQYEGTGLGLALVKQLVEMHGGQVGVTSEMGVGSRFTIDLPCVQAGASPLDTHSAEATVPAVSPADKDRLAPLILLAEDNAANIATFSSYLQARGYRLQVAETGQEAVALARSIHPDLILMDIQMPDMNGLEATRQIRQQPELATVPILALTALAMPGDQERCLAAGANDYLSKPVRLKQLTATIQQWLNHD